MLIIAWLIVLVACLGIEVATVALVTIWFAGGALAAMIVAMITDSIVASLITFFVVSILLLIFTRPMVVKMNRKRTKTNVEAVIGKECKVTESIDNFNETGTVVLNGLEWTARSKEGTVIPAGTRVKICSVSGVKVFVTTEL